MMYCQKCGFQNEDGVKFCMKCGGAMETTNDKAAQAAPAAAPAPVIPAATVPAAQPTPVSEATKFEMPAFILAIISIVLLVFPIPVLAWFSLPCGLVGFMFSLYSWIKCREQKGEISIKVVCAAFFSAYVLLNALTLNMGGGVDILGGVGSLLGGMVGSMY